MATAQVHADHPKSRGEVTNWLYSDGKGKRFQVNNSQVKWESACDPYEPTNYEHPVVLKKPVWADPKFEDDKQNYEKIVMGEFLTGKRFSYEATDLETQVRTHMHHMGSGVYKDLWLPLNPVGRTGMIGRGLLGKYGPNHAADPIVMRPVIKQPGKFEFVAIQRADTKEWAIPGGMVDAGEQISATLKREFMEETADFTTKTDVEKKKIAADVDEMFAKMTEYEVYKGYSRL